MSFQQVNPNEMPGVGESVLNLNRVVWLGRQGVQYLPGGGRIDGANARDPSNTGGQWEAGTYAAQLPPNMTSVESTFPQTLQAGLLLGVVSASGNDLATTSGVSGNTKMYGASIFGITGYALTANATTIVVPAAVGAEILRRVGATGTITVIGPPTTSGTVASQSVALASITQNSAVYWTLNLSNSAQLTAAAVAGSLLCPSDGSQTPVTFLDEIDGIRVTDIYGGNLAVQFPRVPIAGGIVNVANVVNYASTAIATVSGAGAANTTTGNAMVQVWIKTQLNTSGKFLFSDNFPS